MFDGKMIVLIIFSAVGIIMKIQNVKVFEKIC